ncbi:FUSC family protein [Saccharomonospora sp. NPDC006951]
MIIAAVDRIRAADPGLVRMRLAATAVLGIVIAAGALLLARQPLPVVLFAAIGAMISSFSVNDPEKPQQALTLVLAFAAGAASLTAATAGQSAAPLDGVVFVLLIFVAVYAQRFGPRGTALGSITFFVFFFAMFLRTQPAQLPMLFVALATGLAANALVRFVILPRRPGRELVSIRRAFRAWLGDLVRAAAVHLAASGTERTSKQLQRAGDRLHQTVLLIEDVAADVLEGKAAALLRRRAIEVELAAQWLSITVRRTAREPLDPATRAELVARLRRFRSLIERDPRELPVISETEEYTKLLVEGSRLSERATEGDPVRRAVAELALADVNAARIAERDFSAEQDPPPADTTERTPLFGYDNRTRAAIQAVLGGGLAVLGGELVSHQRWYWAVLTVFVVFVGTSSAGATLVKGARRMGGTLAGIFAGALCALLVSGNTPLTVVLVLMCVFGMAFFATVSQTIMAFFITTLLGLLYSLLGTFSVEVLGVRVAETAVGALAGIIAALVVVPVRTRSVLLDDVATVLEDLREFARRSTELLTGRDNVNVIELSRQLDRDVEQVRTTVEPLTHPINPRGSRRNYGWYVVDTLAAIAFRTRHVAARAQPGLLASPETARRFEPFMARLDHNIGVLLDTVRGGAARAALLAGGTDDPLAGSTAGERVVLAGLGKLDEAVLALGKAFDLDQPSPERADGAQSVQVRRRTRTEQAAPDNIPERG